MTIPMAHSSMRELVGEAMERGEPSVMTGRVASISEDYSDPNKVELRVEFGKRGEGGPTSYVKLSKKAAKGLAVDDKVKITTIVEKQA